MKDLIITALNEANTVLEKRVPKTKKDYIQVSIEDVKPLELINFMKENNIPDDAQFSTTYEGETSFGSSVDSSLFYWVEIETTSQDKLRFRKDKFSTIAFRLVSETLTKEGYKRKGFNSGLLKEFDCVYDMYMSGDFDRLVKYYSLYFVFSPEIINH